MTTTVKDLIEKLKQFPEDMPVILEPNIDHTDDEMMRDVAYDVFHSDKEEKTNIADISSNVRIAFF